MAAASFAITLLVYLRLDLLEALPAQSYAADPDKVVEIGDQVDAREDQVSAAGSGQQSVTSFPNVDNANSYWIVRPQPDTSAKQGYPITHGTIVRLQYMRTQKWLHSHMHASPITGNLEARD